MTKLKMLDCYDNRLTFIKGAYFGVSEVRADGRITVCISPTPGRCPTSECAKIRLNESYTFKSGFTVTNRGSQGGYPDAYGIVDVSYTGESVLPEISIAEYINVEVLIPDRDGGFTSYLYSVGVLGVEVVGIPEVELPEVELPDVIPTISKTLIVTRIPSSVFTGDTRTLIGAVDVGGLPVTDEPVVLKVDGVVVDETVTLNGVFVFEYRFDEAGSRKLVFESPATSAYPDYGRDVKRVSVSSVSPDIAERARIEHEEYIARREALAEKRITIPEFGYEPIFRRDVSIVPVVEIPFDKPEIPFVEPEIPFDEPEVQIPTRGSIHVDLPIPPVDMPLIVVPVAVWVDNIFKGNAPITVSDIKVGPHSVVLKMAGFNSPVMIVEVNENEVSYVTGVEMISL